MFASDSESIFLMAPIKTTPALRNLLWTTQHRSGSELQAGGRALIKPSPLHNALCSARGRTIAKAMDLFDFPQTAKNYIVSRIPIYVHLLTAHISDERTNPVVDPFAGFSSQGWDVANKLPHGRSIDIASARMAAEIDRRLRRAEAAGVPRPENHELISANYHRMDLSQILMEPVDGILVNNAYYDEIDAVNVTRHLASLLRPDGRCVVTFPYEPAITEVREAVRFFKSHVGTFPMRITEAAQVVEIMEAAGLRDVEVMMPSQVAAALDLPYQPMLDLELMAVGRP